MGITAQDIYKAFYRFDQKNLPLRRVGDELVKDTQDVNARKKICSELLESFADLDIKIWERIVGMALAECTEYPDMDKLYEFIERAAEPEPAPAAPAPAKKSKQKQRTVPAVDRAAKLKKMFEAAKRGEFKEAGAIIRSSGLPDEAIRDYALYHWPDCNQEWIEENKRNIEQLILDEQRCSNCPGLKQCKRFGYQDCGNIDKYTGNIRIMITMCSQRMEKENEKVS